MPPPHLDETTSAAPQFSPGVVEDEEILLREMFNPQHVKNGKLTKRAIGAKELVSTGYSVHRRHYTSPDFIRTKMQNRTSKRRSDGSFWEDEGVALLGVGAVRSIRIRDKDQERQVFRVIDDASANDRGHASIYVYCCPGEGEAYARKMKRYLLPFLQSRMSVDEAFQPTSQSPP